MKILNSIDKIYQEQLSINEKLKDKVDFLIKKEIKSSWFFDSRIKKPESFALKIETGRFVDPTKLEDFYGCLIVVENTNEIEVAIEKINKYFTEYSRRPKEKNITHKNTDSFPFDDLRLYVKLKKEEFLPPEPIDDITFEIQIKTFLQHAWAITTHDLIYKSDKISWSRERVAFQIKAMLEQAEVSISGVDRLAELPELTKENSKFKLLKEIQKIVTDLWPKDDLPIDVLRLSQNIYELICALRLKSDDLYSILSSETKEGRGVNIRDLSPYNIIVQSIIYQNAASFENYLKNKKGSFKIFLPSEIDLNSIDISESNKLVRI
jgi:ppGpp synthetase/RelA/SpoT-type nucleotidyltranferase